VNTDLEASSFVHKPQYGNKRETQRRSSLHGDDGEDEGHCVAGIDGDGWGRGGVLDHGFTLDQVEVLLAANHLDLHMDY
jgi:hypothetical protein